MSGQRNHWGVNDMCDLYRTVGGERYEWAHHSPSPERMKELRAAGVRCRRFIVDGASEVFVHPDDEAKLEAIMSGHLPTEGPPK